MSVSVIIFKDGVCSRSVLGSYAATWEIRCGFRLHCMNELVEGLYVERLHLNSIMSAQKKHFEVRALKKELGNCEARR